MANNNNDLTVNIKATFDKSNMGDFKSEVTKAVEDAAKSVKAIEIKANTQSARDSMQKFTSYLSKLSNAKDGFTTIKIHANTKDAEKAINDLQSKLKDLKVSFDTSKLGNQLNVALRDINKDDSLKKVKLGTDTSKLLRDINSAINTINNDSSLKKLKLGVDVNYLQQELNKAIKGLDTTVKLKTKLETTSRTSETKGTVTTNKTSKEEAQQYQSLFSKRAASIANLDRAYQEFGRNSKEVSAAIREFAAASKDVRKFGRDTGVLSLNKVKSDIERQLGAGLTTDFTKNWLRMEYDKVLRDIDTLNRQLKPEKYEKAEDDARVKAYNQEYKIRQAIAAAQAKADKDAERAYKERERVLNEELKIRLALGKKGLSGGLSVDEVKNIKEANQVTTALSSQFARLRGEALRAGNALNQATNPKDVERLRAEFQKAIQALVNYQRATRGLTKGGEAQLVEKLAVGNIKEQTEAWKVLYEWVKKTVQAQRDYDISVGRRNPPKSKDTNLMSWFNNMDVGSAVSGMAYAARGELNAVQSFGNLLSSLSKIDGVVGQLTKFAGAITIAGLAVTGAINIVTGAFNQLTSVLGQVGNAIYRMLQPGIELYKSRETAELSIAAAISARATEGGKDIPYERAMEYAQTLMERVVKDAAVSAFNPQDLIDALRGTLPLALGKGLNVEQSYELTKGVASVAKVTRLASNQVLQELRDILQGTISARSSQVAGATGITGEGLREADAQGKLYEYIIDHMKTFTFALNRYSYTLSGALDRLSESWSMGMERVFTAIEPQVNGLINYVIDNFVGGIYENIGTKDNPIKGRQLKTQDEIKEATNAEFFNADWMNDFAKALKDLMMFLGPVIDDVLAFLKELTGTDNVVDAVTESIKYAISVTVALGKILLIVFKSTMDMLIELEAPISLLMSALLKTGQQLTSFGSILMDLATLAYDGAKILASAIKLIATGGEQGGETAWESMKNAGETMLKLKEDLDKFEKSKFTKLEGWETTYEGVFGTDIKSLQNKAGAVTKIFEEISEAKAPPKKTDVDLAGAQGKRTEENKQNLADQRKMIQAMIEDIKQALKQALQELKDIAEQNELAYKQGYKSIEDYFTQKAAIEEKEALLKLEAAIAERDAIASLNTGGDAGAEYQQQRDLIKYESDIATYTREYNKKVAQSNELLGAIQRTLENKTYQTGIVATTRPSTSISNISNIPSGIYYDVADADIDGLTDLTLQKLNAVAYEYLQAFGERIMVTSAKREGDGSSWHDSGQAFDIAMDSLYDESRRLWLKGIAEKYALIPLDEYPGGEGEMYAHGDNFHFSDHGDPIEELIETIEQEAKQSVNQIEGRMPQAFHTLTEAYQGMVKQGQKQMLEAQKEYAKTLNDPELLETISLAEVEADMKEKIAIARDRFASIPAIADNLEKLFPIKKLEAIVNAQVSSAETRLKIMEHDAMAMNRYLREKTTLFPKAIADYASYFFSADSPYSITAQLNKMIDSANKYAAGGQIGKFHEVMSKVEELQNKFISMVESWISEMNEYFNYRRQLVEADSGLTSFVKEERTNQLNKGEARVKAVAYAEEARALGEQRIYWQEKLNEAIAIGNVAEGQSAQYQMQYFEKQQQIAMRQAEINAKLGEQKTLWQETMDAANQALENGLYNFMTDYINTAESIGEAFRNMAIDILKDLQKFFAKKAITDLMHVITGTPNEQYNVPNVAETQTAYNTNMMVYWLQNIHSAVMGLQASQSTSMFTNLGGSMVGGTYIPNTQPSAVPSIGKHATGGYISGKGTSTSDSIPAMLSNGEYVIKADSVRRYGLNFLDAVNNGHFTRMRTVIPRFADGGYVGDALQDTARGMTDFAKNLGTSVGVDNTISIALVRDEQEAIREWAKSPSGGQKFLVDFAKGNGRVFSRFNR